MSAIIIDTETTGFREKEPIQIAWTHVPDLDLSPGERYHQRYAPATPIELGALATHHILEEDLIGCEPYEGSFPAPDGTEYLIGHNIDFDCAALHIGQEYKRICTLALSRYLWPDLDSHSLGAMMYFIDRGAARDRLRNAHDAEADVELTRILLSHILDTLNADMYTTVQTWQDVYFMSERARIPKKMPFGKYKGWAIERVPRDYVNWLARQPDTDPYLMRAFGR